MTVSTDYYNILFVRDINEIVCMIGNREVLILSFFANDSANFTYPGRSGERSSAVIYRCQLCFCSCELRNLRILLFSQRLCRR